MVHVIDRRWILAGRWALAIGLLAGLAILTLLARPDDPGVEPDRRERVSEFRAEQDRSLWRPDAGPGPAEKRAEPEEATTRTVSGTVVLAGGNPLEGITVEALVKGEPTATTRTDAEGRFELRGMVGRRIRIRISGETPDGVLIQSSTRTYARWGARDVEITAKPGAAIEGRVFGPDGLALPDVEVFRGATRGNFWASGAPVRTDEEGRFRHVVPPGTQWRLLVRMASMDDQGMPCQLGGACPVKAGAQDVRIDMQPGEELHGEVVSPDGLPVAGIPLLATLRTLKVFRSTARTDHGGRFVIRGFHPGFYRISIAPDHPADPPRMLLGGEHVRSGRTGLRLVLRESGTISGRLLLASGEPAKRISFDLTHEAGGTSRKVRSGPDGTFVVKNLIRGRYVAKVLRASPAGGSEWVELCRPATGDADVEIHLPR
jgi:Carboxypeptidase regulatory-like domain